MSLSSQGSTPVRRLDEFLKSYLKVFDAQFLKTDTDGHDFAIVTGHADYLADRQPVDYREYMVATASEAKLCVRTFFTGYRHVVVFHNFGHLRRICDPHEINVDAVADQLNTYLVSHQTFRTAVYHLDMYAFTERHKSLDRVIKPRYAGYLAGGRVRDEPWREGEASI